MRPVRHLSFVQDMRGGYLAVLQCGSMLSSKGRGSGFNCEARGEDKGKLGEQHGGLRPSESFLHDLRATRPTMSA